MQERKIRPELVPIGLGIIAALFSFVSWGAVQWVKFIAPHYAPGEETRVIFGGIPPWLKAIFYVSIAAFFVACGWLFSIRTRNWARGAGERRSGRARARLEELGRGMRMQTLLRDRGAGLMHALIFYGFLVLFIGTVTIEIDDFLPTKWKFLEGDTYLAYSFVLELAGLALLGGVCWAFYRRYVAKVYRIRIKTKSDDAIILGVLFFIAASGFLVEALRIGAGEPKAYVAPFADFEKWSFVGYGLAKVLSGVFGSGGWWYTAHAWSWVIHFAGFAAFLIILPTTKMRHMITSPMNMYLSPRERPRGAMRPMPNLMETEIESFGAANVDEFTWKQLFDTDACTMCGRCTSVCPAHNTGKPLDPREIVLKVGETMALSSGLSGGDGDGDTGGDAGRTSVPMTPPVSLDKEITISSSSVFERITAEEVFSCVTCRACDETCPVDIEIVDKILDMRRYLTLMESDFPTELGNAYRGMENAGNPWGMGQHERAAWTDKLDFEVPIVGENTDADHEYLWWVGCAGSFDDRNVHVSRAIATLLHEAGVDYAILGPQEMCTGDPARRSGNEYVFQMLAMQNIETMNELGVRKVITQCPHCFNTLKNEYPQLGGNYEVVHHSELLESLVDEGRLDLAGQVDARVTYHDSCYLGRYNDVFAAPRRILGRIGGVEVVEMPRNGTGSFCCGAGGARMFMEERTGKKIQIERTEEAVGTGADTIATACPFCYVMLDDGIKETGHEESHRVADVSVLMAEALERRMAAAAESASEG